MAEADTPGRFDEDRPPEEESRPSSDDFLPPSHWFSIADRDQFEYHWKPGRYGYKFFNDFSPKEVFNRKTVVSRDIRINIIKSVFGEFSVDYKSEYFRRTSLKRAERDGIKLMYDKAPIAIYYPKDNKLTPIKNKTFYEFKDIIEVAHGFRSTQSLESQVQNEFSDDPDFDLNKELELMDERVRTEKDSSGKILRYVDDVLIPDEVPIDSRFYDGKNPYKKVLLVVDYLQLFRF